MLSLSFQSTAGHFNNLSSQIDNLRVFLKNCWRNEHDAWQTKRIPDFFVKRINLLFDIFRIVHGERTAARDKALALVL